MKIVRIHSRNYNRGCFCFYPFDKLIEAYQSKGSAHPKEIAPGEVCIAIALWRAPNLIWRLVMWKGRFGFIAPDHLENVFEEQTMKEVMLNSQDIIAGMTIVWGGAQKEVVQVLRIIPEVEWYLSDGTYQTLPRDIEVQVVKGSE